MADLFDRLFDQAFSDEGIAVHSFRAAVGDYVAGYTTRNQIVAWWAMDSEAQADLDALLATVDAIPTMVGKVSWVLQLHDVMLISEEGAKYTTKSDFKTRLGI